MYDNYEIFHQILFLIIEDMLVVGMCVSFFVLLTLTNFLPGKSNMMRNRDKDEY